LKLIACKNYQELSKTAADLVAKQVRQTPNSVLGLATGATPVGMYQLLAQMDLDFSQIRTFNLDEYYPINHSDPASYHYFMNEQLFSKLNIRPENIHIPSGEATDAQQECRKYEDSIAAAGGIDLQVLGIGQNGHIGFNEPGSSPHSRTHVTNLTKSTLKANARYFPKDADMPTQAITMGIATILEARHIILLATGKRKAAALKALLAETVNPDVPATYLCTHSNVTVIADQEALS
jgi:glucosamine-6-phosphate deaminase